MNLTSTIKDRYLWILLFLSAVLYLQQSWVPGMFPDGHLYMSFGKNAVEKGFWLAPHLTNSTYPEFGDHIPFIFMLEGIFFSIFGASYSSARIFSGLFSIVTVFGIYSFLRPKNRTWGLYAAFLFLMIPPLLKKTRFPGLDVPLMCFSFFSLLNAYLYLEKEKIKNVLISGLFLGMSFLCKGPVAFFIPVTVLLYILYKKDYRKLIDLNLYLALGVGALIFSLWPLLLYSTDKFHIFEKYIYTTFIHSAANSRGKVNSDYFAYVLFLTKQTPHIIVLYLLSLKYFIREKSSLFVFASVAILSVVFPFSFFSHKYSHYLIPIFPWFAIGASYFFVGLKEKNFIKWGKERGIFIFTCVMSCLLLVFPLTNTSRRDRGVRNLINVSSRLHYKAELWGVIDDAYSFYNVNNLVAYRFSGETFKLSLNDFERLLMGKNITKSLEMKWPVKIVGKKWVFLIEKKKWISIKDKGSYRAIASINDDQLLLIAYMDGSEPFRVKYE